MALATPFKFLDRQMNNPVTDLSKITSTDIFNTIENVKTSISSAVGDLISSIKDKITNSETFKSLKEAYGTIKGYVTEGLDIVNGLYRELKNGIGVIKDLTANGLSALEDAIMSMLPKGVSRSAISNMARRCKDNMGMQNILGKPWDINGGCGGGKGSKDGCTSGSINNLINSVTGGGYSSAFRDVNAILSGLVGLGNLSYNANLCGAFSSLLAAAGPLTGSQIARAGGSILSTLAGKGNILGAADLSKSMIGLNITSLVPNALTTLSTNVGDFAERSIRSIASSGLAGYDLLEDGWDKSGSSDFFSMRNLLTPSDGMSNLLKVGTLNTKIRDLDDFNVGSNASLFSSSMLGDWF